MCCATHDCSAEIYHATASIVVKPLHLSQGTAGMASSATRQTWRTTDAAMIWDDPVTGSRK